MIRKALVGIVVALVAARLALPSAARWQVNRKLAHFGEHYSGRVGAIHFALWRGRIGVRGLEILDDRKELRMTVARLDVKMGWRGLLHRSFLGSVDVREPVLEVHS